MVTQVREHQEEKTREVENMSYNFSLYHAFAYILIINEKKGEGGGCVFL